MSSITTHPAADTGTATTPTRRLTTGHHHQEIDMCDRAFAEWLVMNVEAIDTQTSADHTVVRVHAFNDDDRAAWQRQMADELVTGYLPHPEAWYVTHEQSAGQVKGSRPFETEDEALAHATAIADAAQVEVGA